MRCLLLTQYYPPETGAAPNRLSDWARRLAAGGHEVTVLTAVPNYPRGEIFPGYRDRLLYEEKQGNLRVLRTRIYVSRSAGFIGRLASYFSFVFAAIVAGIIKVKRQDILLVESPPLFAGLAGLFLKMWLRAKMVFNVSDLWPESAVAMGVLHNSRLIRWSTWLEEMLYRHSRLVTGQTEHIVADIRRRTGVATALATNGVDHVLFSEKALAGRQAQRRALGFDGHFVAGYAGLFGLAQGLDVVLDSAEILRQFPDVLFVLVGDGPERARLCAEAERRGLDNVRFYPPQPAFLMPAVMASFDAAIVPLKRLELFKGALPCKLFECMAAGVAVITAIAGEAQELVQAAQGGICVAPEDSGAIAAAILRLRGDPALARRLGTNARSYVLRHYGRQEIACRLEALLCGVAGQSKLPQRVTFHEDSQRSRSTSAVR
ncbi:MAG: glycosyltransferase family 4 protein [Chlamydiota bacterium]